MEPRPTQETEPPAKEVADPTRERLLLAATLVFAEQGFQAATVREISGRVGANVAAVNYHFGDKLGLYTAVLRRSLMADEDEVTKQLIQSAQSPPEALRIFIERMLAKTAFRSEAGFQFQIMAQEMVQPTPALSQVVHDVIEPKFKQLKSVLAQILHVPAEHHTTNMCAHSLIGQIMHYANARPVIVLLSPEWEHEKDLRSVTEHVFRFTMNGLRGMSSAGLSQSESNTTESLR